MDDCSFLKKQFLKKFYVRILVGPKGVFCDFCVCLVSPHLFFADDTRGRIIIESSIMGCCSA